MKAEDLLYLAEKEGDTKVLSSLGVFPKEFIQFLHKYNLDKIKSKNAKISIPYSTDFVYLNSFLNIQNLFKLNVFFYHEDKDEELIKNNLIIIAKTSASIYICISLHEKEFGKIYLYGWDLGRVLISNNLNDFFDSLSLDSNTSL